MKKQHITKLEAQLEQLVENVFTSLFSKRIRAHDIALRLARAMEDGLHFHNGQSIAPDQYTIFLNPQVHQSLIEKHPEFTRDLAAHLTEFATQVGYHLKMTPTIKLLADAKLDPNQLDVFTTHSDDEHSSTAVLQGIERPTVQKPPNTYIVINGEQSINLEDDLINLGRQPDNDIVIDDQYISRHHIQLRLKSGKYILFDVDSRGGTYVNNVEVKEHTLKSGDIIRIGRTQILYLQDENHPAEETQAFEPYL